MNIQEHQIETIAYIFERANGKALTNFEEEQVSKTGFGGIPPDQLAGYLVDTLNSAQIRDAGYRNAAYWALSKRFDLELLPQFQHWLRDELAAEEMPALFQLMIALDNLNEPIFGDDRDGGYSTQDVELNMRDANRYLESIA